MVTVEIPGYDTKLELKYLVLDFNGTLAIDGILFKGLKSQIEEMSKLMEIHVVTGDGFGTAKLQLEGVACQLKILGKENEAVQKKAYVEQLGVEHVLAVGNGRNDLEMVRAAKLGIIVVQEEGASAQSMMAADIICRSIFDVFAMIHEPRKIRATLRI